MSRPSDRVPRTPPTSTSANNPAGAPEKPQDSLYLPTDTPPEQLFIAIGQLRKEARDEIDRLIAFLDKTDDYVSRELEVSIDDGPCDDDELDGPENAEDELSEPNEPSLGALERHASVYGPEGYNGSGDQTNWAAGGTTDVEDEHDGAEPENEGGCGAKEDDEPSLGWPERLRQDYASNGSQSGDDRELQDHATVLPAKPRNTKGVL